jgi:sRNA-binding carbon storage regulator CsrA
VSLSISAPDNCKILRNEIDPDEIDDARQHGYELAITDAARRVVDQTVYLDDLP